MFLIAWTASGCRSIEPSRESHATGAASSTTNGPPRWHSIVVEPRANLPDIHFYDKLNPVWWFENSGEPLAPDWYRPDGHCRDFMWHMRNPFANFTSYVIGVADKRTVRSGVYPEKVGNPNEGWNFAVTRWGILYLPFLDYKRHRFEFYFGWRTRGDFGIKLNFRQAPRRPKRPDLHPFRPEISKPETTSAASEQSIRPATPDR